jgi:hypothetical protein
MDYQWTKWELDSDGSSNMPFVVATGGLKAEHAGQSAYVEVQFGQGDDETYAWTQALDAFGVGVV